MSEPNPYEPPRERERAKNEQIGKRGTGFGAILLLALGAMILTCGVSETIAGWSMAQFRGGDRDTGPLLLGLIIYLVPPVIVFVAVLWVAARTAAKRRRKTRHD